MKATRGEIWRGASDYGKLFRQNCVVGQRTSGRDQTKERLSELIVSSGVEAEQRQL
jgi:hypothetical protein